jgi:hypothetical protein
MIILQQTRGLWSSGALSSSLDADAQNYITAVEAADGQLLETATRLAINNFVKGCKSDGIWNAIKASCILAGARTLSGALVPLVGTAPTNFNFVSSDYSRTTGLKGDGFTKSISTNRNNNTDPQDSRHLYCKLTQADTLGATASYYIGTVFSNGHSYVMKTLATQHGFRSSGGNFGRPSATAAGSWAVSRSGTSITTMAAGSSQVFTGASSVPASAVNRVFGSNSGTSCTDARISFYSVGENLDLSLLDTRVSNLMTTLAAAIP